MVDYKEIPESVFLQSNMAVVIQKFRNKARAYKLVKDADLKFESVKGARVSQPIASFSTAQAKSLLNWQVCRASSSKSPGPESTSGKSAVCISPVLKF